MKAIAWTSSHGYLWMFFIASFPVVPAGDSIQVKGKS